MAPVDSDEYKAFCKVCKVELKTHKNDLRKHAESRKHLQKCKNNEDLSTSKPVDQLFQPTVSEARKMAEIRTSVFVAKRAAVLSVDHLSLLIPKIFPDLIIASSLKLHRTKCTGLLVNFVSPCLFEELIQDIGDNFYSLIIDESTDVSQEKMLAVCVRYFSKKSHSIVTTFLKMVPLGESATSEAIGEAICKVTKDARLTLEKLIVIGVDGCSTMVGVHHSLATYFVN